MKVCDLASEELKTLIEDAVEKKLKEILFDPDEGLELREEVKKRLLESFRRKRGIPVEKVAEELSLKW